MRFPLCRLHPTNITHDRRRESAFCSNQGLSAKKSASPTLLLFFLSSRVLSFPSFSRGNRGLLLRADLPPLPPPPPPPPLHNPKNARQKRERKRNKRGEESSLFFFLLTAFLFLFFLTSPLSLFPPPFGCLFLPLLLAPLFPSPTPRIRWSRERRVKKSVGSLAKGKETVPKSKSQAFHNLFLEIVTPSVEWFPHDCLPPCHCKPRHESSTTSQHLHVLHYAKKETRWFVGTLAKCEALDGGVFLLCYRACKLLDFFLAYTHMNSVRSRLRVF